jgi:hypothetical protein
VCVCSTVDLLLAIDVVLVNCYSVVSLCVLCSRLVCSSSVSVRWCVSHTANIKLHALLLLLVLLPVLLLPIIN